ncbi:sulfite exporter TauE/SafE family protein [Bacteriovoracaceae bacterium]|nr:sulfite exporter TauE/SafE family protein [Bacteriovoracaceae bacterium]
MIVMNYFAIIIMGMTLGLLGGGGSILTVPILVYLFHLPPTVSTGYSLFLVGASAVIGAIQYYRKGLFDVRVGIIFSLPAFVGVYLVRSFIVPNLPSLIFTIGSFEVTKDILILSTFGIVMLAAGISMIRGRNDSEGEDKKLNYTLVMVEGLIVGALTGFVGAGGGFLIIPALVMLAGLPMKKAVGTSLGIIAVKSLLGFAGDIQHNPNIDWNFLGVLLFFSIIGIFLGGLVSKKIAGSKLKPGFGWFTLAMGVFLILKQI